MKVLWIGHYRDESGWARACIDQVLALDSVGVQVVPRCVNHGGRRPELPPRLLELERGDSRGCDVAVQNLLPSEMEYHGDFRNIAYYFAEVSDFRPGGWTSRINLLDEAWVPCLHNRVASLQSNVNVPISIVPPAVDTSRFAEHHAPLPFKERMGDPFVFYAVGENIRRKNFPALVKAFHLEFRPDEPVELLIKTGAGGVSPDAAKARLQNDLALVKRGLNLYPSLDHYKDEIVVTERWSEATMCRLHATCDCYVSPSFGEGWNLPAMDALGFGSTPIVTAYGAHLDYIDDEVGYLVGGRMEPVFGMPGDLYTGWQDWFAVDVRALQRAMRLAYEDRRGRSEKADAGLERAYNYSHAAVGRLMKERLA